MTTRITRRLIVDQTSDGKWNVLSVPPEQDLSKGLPTGGTWFDSQDEAIAEVERLISLGDPKDE